MQRFFAGCVRSVKCWKNYNQFATTSKHQYSYQSEVEEKVILQGPLLERPTLASRVPLFLLGHFLTNECEISDFCL